MITTARLYLRPPLETDLDAIFELHSDPRTNVHNPVGPMTSRDQAAELLATWQRAREEHGYGYWAVAHLDRPETVIGFGGVMKKQIAPELHDNNLYFRFCPEAWGRGYAGELARAALETAFLTWSLRHVFGMTRTTNVASQKVLERAGFRRIGTVDDLPGGPPSLLYKVSRKSFGE